MPFCRNCGFEYKEGDTFCNKCSNKLLLGESTGPIKKDELKAEDGAALEKTPVRAEESKGGSIVSGLIIGLLILGVLGAGTYAYIQMQQQKNVALKNQVAQYQNVVRDDLAKLNSISEKDLGKTRAALFAGDPSGISYSAYAKHVEDYSNQANLNKQHLMEFKDFVTTNETALQAVGVDTIQLKSSIDNDLSNIDKNLREMQAALQKLKEQEAVRALIDQFNQYIAVLNDDVTKLNAVSKKYPAKMSNDVYIQYARDYSAQATVYRQHLIDFKNFISRNELLLQSNGVNTIEGKAIIDRGLSTIDQDAKNIEKNIQNIAEQQKQAVEQQKQTLELLKLLLPLFL